MCRVVPMLQYNNPSGVIRCLHMSVCIQVGRFLERVVDWGNSSLNAWHQNPACVGWEANQSVKAASALDSAAAPLDTQGMHHVSSLSSVSTQAYLNHPASSQHVAPDLDASPSKCPHAVTQNRTQHAHKHLSLPSSAQQPTHLPMDLDSSRSSQHPMPHTTPQLHAFAQSDFLTALQDQRQRSCHLSLQRRTHDPHAHDTAASMLPFGTPSSLPPMGPEAPIMQDSLACASLAGGRAHMSQSVNAYTAASDAVPMSVSDINSSVSTVDSGVQGHPPAAQPLSTVPVASLQPAGVTADSLQSLQSIGASVAAPPEPHNVAMRY